MILTPNQAAGFCGDVKGSNLALPSPAFPVPQEPGPERDLHLLPLPHTNPRFYPSFNQGGVDILNPYQVNCNELDGKKCFKREFMTKLII